MEPYSKSFQAIAGVRVCTCLMACDSVACLDVGVACCA